jgi:hypothetical protein
MPFIISIVAGALLDSAIPDLAAGAPGPFDIQVFMLSKSLPLLLGYFVVSFIADKHHVNEFFYN